MAPTKTATETGTTGSGPSTADLQAQLEILQADVANLTRALGEYGRAQGENLRGMASDRARRLRADAEAGVRLTEAQLREAYSEAEDAVRRNPGTSVAIASGIGFVIGLLLSRR